MAKENIITENLEENIVKEEVVPIISHQKIKGKWVTTFSIENDDGNVSEFAEKIICKYPIWYNFGDDKFENKFKNNIINQFHTDEKTASDYYLRFINYQKEHYAKTPWEVGGYKNEETFFRVLKSKKMSIENKVKIMEKCYLTEIEFIKWTETAHSPPLPPIPPLPDTDNFVTHSDYHLDFMDEIINDNGKTTLKPRPQIYIAEIIHEMTHCCMPSDAKENYDQLLTYQNGVYTTRYNTKIINDIFIKGYGKDYYEDTLAKHMRIAIMHSYQVHPDEFNHDINLVNCLNGMVDINTLEILPHDPKYLSTVQIPIEFVPGAECPEFDAFLHSVVDEKDVPKIYEFMGYILYRGRMKNQQAFILISTGETGKGTLILAIKAFAGRSNCTEKSISDLENKEWSVAYLKDALVNLVGDISGQRIKDSTNFKRATGGDGMSGQVKYKQDIEFDNRCKLLFAGNAVPPSDDMSHGYLRRWQIVKFPHKFSAELGNIDLNILERMTAPVELSGMLNKSLVGLATLLQNNGVYTNSLSADENADCYDYEANSFYIWADESLMSTPGYTTSSKILHDNYVEWCHANNIIIILSAKQFGKKLASKFRFDIPRIESVQIWVPGINGEKGKNHKHWQGISLNYGADNTIIDVPPPLIIPWVDVVGIQKD